MEARAYTQVSYIIGEMSENLKSKIPTNIINLMEKNKDKNYKITGKISDLKLLEDTKKILSVLYTDYIATEEEKKVIKNKERIISWQEEKEKGEYQDIFDSEKNT